ncbi:MAG: hypothetical protein M3H12_16880, partial [Chromatiales bacterium]
MLQEQCFAEVIKQIPPSTLIERFLISNIDALSRREVFSLESGILGAAFYNYIARSRHVEAFP